MLSLEEARLETEITPLRPAQYEPLAGQRLHREVSNPSSTAVPARMVTERKMNLRPCSSKYPSNARTGFT